MATESKKAMTGAEVHQDGTHSFPVNAKSTASSGPCSSNLLLLALASANPTLASFAPLKASLWWSAVSGIRLGCW